MLKKLVEFFSGEAEASSLIVDSSGDPTAADLHVATAVILFEMAGRDEKIHPTEADAIVNTMTEQFQLDSEEVPDIMKVATASLKEKGKIDIFVNILNENFNDSQRQKVLAMIWAVVIADGQIDKFEERFAKQMQNRFKLSDEMAAEARGMAESGRISG